MKDVAVFKDTRLLEALDYIDRDLIAEVIDDIKVPDADAVPGKSKKTVLRSVKQVLMLAACVVLISAFIPMISYVMERYDISLGGIFGHDTTEQTTPDDTVEHSNDPSYPIFTPDLEPISDEMIAELKDVWYQKIYDYEYAACLKYYEESILSPADKENNAVKAAQNTAARYAALLFSTNKEDHFRGRYYGIISDCVIFAINTYLEDEYNVITLGRTSIVNDYSIHIFAYKDGIIKNIEVAYSDGWLSAADAEKIKERHNKFNTYGYWKVDEQLTYSYAKFVSDLEDISDKKIEQINNTIYQNIYERVYLQWESDITYTVKYGNTRRTKEEYAKEAYSSVINAEKVFVMNKKEDLESYVEHFRYYGTFGNCIIWAQVGIHDTITEYDLEYYKFYFSNYASINVYSNGQIYDLQEAFDEGILDIDNACKLYHRYLTYEAYLLSDRTAPILAFSEKAAYDDIYNEATSGRWVVFNDAFVTEGEDVWNEFYEKCSNGQPAAVNIVNYYPSRSAIYLTTIVYNRGQFEQYTEARSGGYTNFLYSKYNHIIKYDGAILDKNDTVYDHEETYILVNDNTLTYPKIKESGTSINHYVAFSKLSRVDDTPVSFNITPEQEAIITEIFGHYYSHNEGHWKYWFDGILTAKEAEIWNREAPSDILSILEFLSSNSRFYRLWRSSGSSSSDSKINHVEMTPEQDAIITELVPAEYKCYAGYWDIWFYKMLYSIETKEWNSTQPDTSSEIQQLMEKFNIYNRLTTNVPIYP